MNGYLDDNTPWYGSERRRDLMALFISATLFAVVWYLGSADKALASMGAVWVLYVVTAQMWDHRREKWLWISVFAFAAIHIGAIYLIPFRLPNAPAISFVFPIMIVDGLTMWGLLRWLAGMFLPDGATNQRHKHDVLSTSNSRDRDI